MYFYAFKQGSYLIRKGIILLILLIILCPVFVRAQAEKSSIFGMEAGIGYGKLRSNDLKDKEFNFTPSYTKSAGFTLELAIPNLEKRGTLFNELSFSQFEANSFVRIPDTSLGRPDRDYIDVTQKFSPNLFTVSNMFRYCFTNSDFKYYVSIGIYNSFVISPVNRKTIQKNQNGTLKTNEEKVIPDYATHGLMLLLGTGISYKYIGFELRYDPGRNYTRKIDYSIHIPTITAIIHVRFY